MTVKSIKVLFSRIEDNAHQGQQTFKATREGTAENEDGTTEIAIGWPGFEARVHVDNGTLRKLGNPQLMNVTIEPVRDNTVRGIPKEGKKKGE